jgi:hypothetical protein
LTVPRESKSVAARGLGGWSERVMCAQRTRTRTALVVVCAGFTDWREYAIAGGLIAESR